MERAQLPKKRRHTEATKQKLRLANLGKKLSEETKAKMRASYRSRLWTKDCP